MVVADVDNNPRRFQIPQWKPEAEWLLLSAGGLQHPGPKEHRRDPDPIFLYWMLCLPTLSWKIWGESLLNWTTNPETLSWNHSDRKGSRFWLAISYRPLQYYWGFVRRKTGRADYCARVRDSKPRFLHRIVVTRLGIVAHNHATEDRILTRGLLEQAEIIEIHINDLKKDCWFIIIFTYKKYYIYDLEYE